MKKIPLLLVGVLMASASYAENSKIEVKGTVDDGTETLQSSGLISKYFTTGVRQQQNVTLTASSFTNVSVPSGAKAVLVDVGTVDGIKLKGVTGDTGISLDDVAPLVLPLSQDGTVTLGFQNMEASAQVIKVYFF